MVLRHVYGVHNTSFTPRGHTPHSLPIQFITREHMMALHVALLEWLLQGHTPDLWTRGCLNQGILPPQGTCTCPYDCLIIATANLLPKGKSRLAPCPPLGASPIPLIMGATTMETSLHPTSLTGVPMDQIAKEIPHRVSDDPDPTTRAARPPPSAQRALANKSSPLLMLLSKRGLLRRATMAKRAHYVRIRANKSQHQFMLTGHWPELRPVSLPVYHWTKAPPPLLPRSLPSLGWKRDPSHMIRLDLPKGAPFLYPHSPQGSPPHLRPGLFLPDSDSHMSTSPKADPDGITHSSDLDGLPTSIRTDRGTNPGHAPAFSSTVEGLKFLTINTQKAGANIPSLIDNVTMLDQHSPNLLFLTKNPLHPHSGALPHALRNRG